MAACGLRLRCDIADAKIAEEEAKLVETGVPTKTFCIEWGASCLDNFYREIQARDLQHARDVVYDLWLLTGCRGSYAVPYGRDDRGRLYLIDKGGGWRPI